MFGIILAQIAFLPIALCILVNLLIKQILAK
jgi:hypothetical protein